MRLADALRLANSEAFPVFTREVSLSHHFELQADAVAMALAVAKSDARRRLAAYQFCRLPFKTVWMEWLAGNQPPFLFTKEYPIKRLGVLLEADDETYACGTMTFSALHVDGSVNVLPLGAYFDFRRDVAPEKVPDSVQEHLGTLPEFQRSDYAELMEMAGRISLNYNSYNLKYMDEYEAWDKALQKEAVTFFSSMLRGKVQFTLAAIATLNSRNLVSVADPEDLSRLNRARAKNKKAPLLSFRTVRVSLSAARTRRAQSDGNGPMPLHIVRGHFKVRKSGIYWWSPFWRGDAAAGVVSRKGYEVVA